MPSEQLLLMLPKDLVQRFRPAVPERQRSAYVRSLLETALGAAEEDDEDPLFQAAIAVENDSQLAREMGEWESATVSDGLDADGLERR